ncbi:MAG: signal peptide peptidase SppA [Deltaproteobacteria bacterium]|nr:signal peptide peptidase SppA [Deltaproteobacteria bacterium]
MLFRLLLAPLALLVRVLLFPRRALRRVFAAPKGALIEVTLKGLIRETPARPRKWWPPRNLLRRERASEVHVRSLRRVLDEAIADARVSGVLVRIDGLAGGWASFAALREEIARVRAAGKRLVAWLPHGGGNRELYVASAASTIVTPRTADVALVGPKIEGHYARSALDKLGIDVELHARKEFKSAGDRVARDGRSEADRQQNEALLDAVFAALIAAVAEGRGVPEARVRGWIDDGPTHGEIAVERGLVDHVAHDDDLPTLLGAPVVPAGAYAERRGLGRSPYRLVRRRAIGIVEVHGAIASTATPLAQAMGPLAIAERVIADLRAAERDPRIAAVVLDIDSPGGTVGASDAIWAAAHRLAAKKPVVARMGDVAASGGYWIAVAAKTIVARPLTVTGSIGVVAVRPIAARLAERLGIARDVIARGRFADLDAVTRAPTDEERALFAREIDAHYGAFVAHVAAFRGMVPDEVERVARGRVWTGAAALEQRLVDRLGGLDEAVAVLRSELGPLRLDEEPRVVVGRLPSRRDPAPRPAAAAILELLPESLRTPASPLVAAIAEGARVAAIALVSQPR